MPAPTPQRHPSHARRRPWRARGRRRLCGAALWLCGAALACAATAAAPASQVAVPIAMDYPLLRQLLLAQLFTGAGATREVLEDPTGCSEIVLSNPTIAPNGAELDVLADLRARVGVGAAGACTTLLTWQGRAGVTGRPEVRGDGTALGFDAQRIRLLDQAGRPLANDQVQRLAGASVLAQFARFTVDLAPQLQSVGALLPEVLPRHSRGQVEALLATLRVNNLRVTDAALAADIVFAMEQPATPAPPEHALTQAELALWEERWQLMDALLVMAVKHYAAATGLRELREALLDVLIESRYRLRDALQAGPDSGDDPVRDWFLQSWQDLAPVIGRVGLEQPGQEHLLLVSVVAAADALAALDRLGPGFGLDISADGLRRLARLINAGAGEGLLEYTEGVDPALRELLDESAPAAPPAALRWPDVSFFPRAWAADASRLNSWAPQRSDLPQYLPQVAALLRTSAQQASTRRTLERQYKELFANMVLATAWQESCWRHYVVSDDRKLVPLRSGTGDVGLMQMNERVWRGFYDQQRLRWDIEYNGRAGAEVLLDYLMKYALRKGEHKQPGGLDNLARASYSAYNGGPSQVARYRSKKASSYGKKVDTAFWDKYQQVSAGNELAVSRCLGGNLSGRAVAGGAPAGAGSAAPQPAAAHSPAHFTLQLGAFSSAQNAQSFIAQHALGKQASVRQRREKGVDQFLVLYGSYATRAQADAAKQQLAKLQPWVRTFGDL